MIAGIKADNFKNMSDFSVSYKPVVNIRTGQIKGLEAECSVMINNHEVQYGSIRDIIDVPHFYRNISPEAFSYKMDMLMTNAAVRSYVGMFDDASHINETRLHVHFSSHTLDDPEMLINSLDGILEGTGKQQIRPSDLVIEIDSHARIRNSQNYTQSMRALNQAGYGIIARNFADTFLSSAIRDSKNKNQWPVILDESVMHEICASNAFQEARDSLLQFQDCLGFEAIKLGPSLTRNLAKSYVRQPVMDALYRNMEDMGIYFIAEGIDTEDDVKFFSRYTNIPLGQGRHIMFGQAVHETLVKRWFVKEDEGARLFLPFQKRPGINVA